MLLLLEDAKLYPKILEEFGPIPDEELQNWLLRSGMKIPADLIEFLRKTGGADVFESETILRPAVPSVPSSAFVDDDIERRNAAHTGAGKPQDLYVFQEGCFLSAVRLSDQCYVTLTSSYQIKYSFANFDDWYVGTLRAEFGDRYGLRG